MAVVPYYNRKGYDELSTAAEAALVNIQNEICDKVVTEKIFCRLIAEYKFDDGILEFDVTEPFLDNEKINNIIKHYIFYNEAYQLGYFIITTRYFRIPPEFLKLYIKSKIMWIIQLNLEKYKHGNPKFTDDFILNRINRAYPEAPLPTLNLRIDTYAINTKTNKFKGTHEQYLIPTRPLYIPILNGKEHAPFWNISENDLKVNSELLNNLIKDFVINVD